MSLRAPMGNHSRRSPRSDTAGRGWAVEPQTRELSAAQTILNEFLASRSSARMLDAGCGARRNLSVPEGVYSVGIDVSERQLSRNQDLAERILGDLQTHALPEQSFDLVICWEVLEHLAKPDAALENMRRALKRDGLMILGLPNLMSVKGLITKLTPHAFHVWFYRRVLHSHAPEEEDSGPFRTFFRRTISPQGIRRFAGASALNVEYFAVFESPVQRRVRLRYHLTGRLWRAIRFAVKCVTLGTVDPERTELIVMLGGPDLRSESRSQI